MDSPETDKAAPLPETEKAAPLSETVEVPTEPGEVTGEAVKIPEEEATGIEPACDAAEPGPPEPEPAETRQQAHENSAHPPLPLTMKYRLILLDRNRPKSIHPTHVMHAIHNPIIIARHRIAQPRAPRSRPPSIPQSS